MFRYDVEDFCEEVVDTWTNTPYAVNVVGDYDEVLDVLNELLIYDSFTLFDVVLQNPDLCDYDDAYILCVEEDGEICVYPALIDNEYVTLPDFETVFVFEDVNSRFWTINEDCDPIEVDFAEECDGDCANCNKDGYETELSKDSKDELHGYTRSKYDEDGSYYSESFYSSDTDLVRQMLNIYKF